MNKPIWKSKTVLVALIAFILAIVQFYGIEIPTEVYTALAALGLYSVRDAIK